MVLPCHVYPLKFNSRVSESRILHGLGFPKSTGERGKKAEMRLYMWIMEPKQSKEESENTEKGAQWAMKRRWLLGHLGGSVG